MIIRFDNSIQTFLYFVKDNILTIFRLYYMLIDFMTKIARMRSQLARYFI